MICLSGVNYINILQAPFLYKSAFCSFSLLIVWLCYFWQNNIDAKAPKLLMKLITGINFINTLADFASPDSKKQKKTDNFLCF